MRKETLVPSLVNEVLFYDLSPSHYFAHNHENNHRIKISNEAYEILTKIDGLKNLKELQSEINYPLDIDFLFNFLFIEMGKYGIIDSKYVDVKSKEKPSYLKMSFIVFPEKFVAKISRQLHFLFKKRLVRWVLPLLILILTLAIFLNLNLVFNSSIKEFDFLLFFLLAFISVTFHELGHATAASYFGARHGGIGGGFYFITPVYFADVTDIWKLPVPQRIVVNLAGIYFEFIINGIYIIIGYFLGINILIVAASIISLTTLLNLNPFLRSDGYWIVSDLSNTPNLHKTSQTYLFAFFRKLFVKSDPNSTKFSRKQIALMIYGSVNYLFLILFLGSIVLNPQSVIYFPKNLYNYIILIFQEGQPFVFNDLGQFILPALFYYLLSKLLIALFKKIKR